MIDEDLFQPRRWNKLQEDLKKVLGGQMEVNSLVEGVAFPLFHPAVQSRRPTRVEVDNAASDFYTVIDVFTQDCPGLLYRITRKIFELGLNIWMSRISTKVDQVADAFYVQDLSGAKLEDKEIIGTIQRELIAELEKE
ncbi:MAG: hypothetical protein NTY64_10185 [Deltaproteobacteria bacterium]|nr:hypothetical protein [Deltaproteobacteria bacterium]